MKKLKNIFVSGLLALGALGTITFTSCNRDECEGVQCQNGGLCDENDGSCGCATGYEGSLCETASRDKFTDTWSASDVTGTVNLVYSVTIANGANVTDVTISNDFSDDFFDNTITATVDGNTISIPDQRPDGTLSDYRVTGTGTYNAAGEIIWDYTLTQITTGAQQRYTGTWE